MGFRKKYILPFLLVSILGVLSSCTVVTQTTTEMTSSVKYTKYTDTQMLLLILSQMKDIEDSYTSELWDRKLDTRGTTYQQVFMGEMKQFFKDLLILEELAQEKGVRLSTEEEVMVSGVANEWYQYLKSSNTIFKDLTHEEVDKLYKDYALARKTKIEITKEEVNLISEDNARILILQQIILEDEESVKKVEEELQQEDMDFYTIAKQNSISSEINIVVGHEDLSKEADPIVCELADGEISKTIQSDNKYYIYKCIDGYDEEATAKKKEVLKAQKQEEVFYKAYQEFLSRNEFEINPEEWKEVEAYTEQGKNILHQQIKELGEESFFSLYMEEIGI